MLLPRHIVKRLHRNHVFPLFLLWTIFQALSGCGGAENGAGAPSAEISPDVVSAQEGDIVSQHGTTSTDGIIVFALHEAALLEVTSQNQQGQPISGISVQFLTDGNAGLLVVIDEQSRYSPTFVSLTDETQAQKASVERINAVSDVIGPLFKTPITLIGISNEDRSRGVVMGPAENLLPEDVKVLSAMLADIPPDRFYHSKDEALAAVSEDFRDRAIISAVVLGSSCIGGAVVAGVFTFGAGAAVGCGATVTGARIAMTLGDAPTAGIADVFTIENYIEERWNNDIPADQRFTIADLKTMNIASSIWGLVFPGGGGKARIILPIEPDNLFVLPELLTFAQVDDQKKIAVTAEYTYFGKVRDRGVWPPDFLPTRIYAEPSPPGIVDIQPDTITPGFLLTKLLPGEGEVRFVYQNVAVRTRTVGITEENSGTSPPPEEVSLVGVVPETFTTNGGTFKISVSPKDADGNLITGGVTAANFSFEDISVLPAGAVGPPVTGGSADVTGIDIIEPQSGDQVTLVLDFDSSGSMVTNDPSRLRVDAGKQLVSILTSDDQAAIIDFGAGSSIGLTASRLLQDFTSDKTLLDGAIDQVTASGGTPLFDSLLDALDLLAGVSAINPAVVVLTDGEENQSFSTFSDVVAQATAQATPLFTIGLGSSVDFTQLQNLAGQTGGTFAEAQDANALNAVFENIGFGIIEGRVIVTGQGRFIPPLVDPGDYVVSGVLVTTIRGVSVDTPFNFNVEVVMGGVP